VLTATDFPSLTSSCENGVLVRQTIRRFHCTERTSDAIGWLRESIDINPLPPALAYLASAYALQGDDLRARRTLSEFARRQPHETLATFGGRVLADHQILPGSRVFEGLRKAGLRETKANRDRCARECVAQRRMHYFPGQSGRRAAS
jgi:hypothetical protein